MSIQYETFDEIEAIVQGFETCSLSKADFIHRNHLTVALWYLKYNSFEDAAALMRAGLLRFIEHHDVPREKYNETITMFWLKAVQAFIEKRRLGSQEADLLSLTNELLQDYQDPGLVFEYYSRDLVFSPAARIDWVEPDVRVIDLW
ncbi:MAG: hypothetical protein QOE77_2883 [Blastocatellia bacterium]|jgi:hypothetical protein|nr:hypothetical protein [Blastocatellia bacterium]